MSSHGDAGLDRRVLVADDEPPARRRLAELVDELPGYQVVATAENGVQALQQSEQYAPDIVLLDIRMPGLNGLQVAARMLDWQKPPAVIFCTAYDEHALEAFDVSAAAYLLKPIQSDYLLVSLEKAASINRAQLAQLHQLGPEPSPDATAEKAGGPYLLARTGRGQERVAVGSIRALIADKKYVSAYIAGRELILDRSLKSLEAEFGQQFVRVHRNALVARAYILGIEKSLVEPGEASLAGAARRVLGGRSVEQLKVRLEGVDIMPVISRRHAASVRRLLRAAK